jgi:hypothetical protein
MRVRIYIVIAMIALIFGACHRHRLAAKTKKAAGTETPGKQPISATCTLNHTKQSPYNCTEYFSKDESQLTILKGVCDSANSVEMRKLGTSSIWSIGGRCDRAANYVGECRKKDSSEVTYAEKAKLDEAAKGAMLACEVLKGTWVPNPKVKVTVNQKDREEIGEKISKVITPDTIKSAKAALVGNLKGACYHYLSGKLTECNEYTKLSDFVLTTTRSSCEAMSKPSKVKEQLKLDSDAKWVTGELCSRENVLGVCIYRFVGTDEQTTVWYKGFEQFDGSGSATAAKEKLKTRTCGEIFKGKWQDR